MITRYTTPTHQQCSLIVNTLYKIYCILKRQQHFQVIYGCRYPYIIVVLATL